MHELSTRCGRPFVEPTGLEGSFLNFTLRQVFRGETGRPLLARVFWVGSAFGRFGDELARLFGGAREELEGKIGSGWKGLGAGGTDYTVLARDLRPRLRYVLLATALSGRRKEGGFQERAGCQLHKEQREDAGGEIWRQLSGGTGRTGTNSCGKPDKEEGTCMAEVHGMGKRVAQRYNGGAGVGMDTAIAEAMAEHTPTHPQLFEYYRTAGLRDVLRNAPRLVPGSLRASTDKTDLAAGVSASGVAGRRRLMLQGLASPSRPWSSANGATASTCRRPQARRCGWQRCDTRGGLPSSHAPPPTS